jgi:hypothetical protein
VTDLPHSAAPATPKSVRLRNQPAGTPVATPRIVEHRTLAKAMETQRRAKLRVRDATGGVPWARVANLALGVWLQFSAFAWPHDDGSRLSAWAPGLLISIIALLSMGAPPMRWLNVFLALVLIGWTFAATSVEPLSYLNGMVVGVLVLCFSVVPSKSQASDFRD